MEVGFGGPSVIKTLVPTLLLSIQTELNNDNSMIIRRASTCLRLSRATNVSSRIFRNGTIQRRCVNTSAPTATPKPSPVSPLAAITSELDDLSPRFDISAESIEIIRGPTEFFEALKVGFPVYPNYRFKTNRNEVDKNRQGQKENLPINSVCRSGRTRIGMEMLSSNSMVLLTSKRWQPSEMLSNPTQNYGCQY